VKTSGKKLPEKRVAGTINGSKNFVEPNAPQEFAPTAKTNVIVRLTPRRKC